MISLTAFTVIQRSWYAGWQGFYPFYWGWIVFAAVAVAIWVLLVRLTLSGRCWLWPFQMCGAKYRSSPEEILKTRLASGEITGEEFEELRRRMR